MYFLPSSASTQFQLQLRLSWFYFQLIQQPTHPRKSFNWNWRGVKSKRTDSRPHWDYFKLIYTHLQNWLNNTLTKKTSMPQNLISSTRIYLFKYAIQWLYPLDILIMLWQLQCNFTIILRLHQDCFKITSRLLQDIFKYTSFNWTGIKCLDDICPMKFFLVFVLTHEVLHILAVTDLIWPNHKVRIMWSSTS